jgi:flagellar hook assembly protein FlgD
MGSADADASNVYVFPLPWRPHGPDAGDGPGQTGTDAGGITFSNLPSECTIKIYTVSGHLVRALSHSDLAGPVGQEKWDGNTSSGDHAASGVYLWRVESSADSKNGKLMVIR